MPRETECGFAGLEGINAPDMLTRLGPTIHVHIGLDPHYRPGSGNPPVLPDVTHPTLIDTGANLSCIDASLAADLQLPIVDRQPFAGIHGAHECNMHVAQIHIPAFQWVITGRFAGVHLQAGGQPHRALIGRMFLEKIKMVYDGQTGSVILSIPD